MTEVKQAVKSATDFLVDLFPEAKEIRLEEVEPRSEGWNVVMSFKTGESPTLASVMGGNSRLYKIIYIRAGDGEPESLKVWNQ